MTRASWLGREGAAAGLAFLILAALSALPQFSLLVVWLLPMPLIVFTVLRMRFVPPILAAVAGACLLAVGFGWSALLFALGIYFLGWVMGESIMKSDSPYAPLITGTLVLLMLELVLLALIRWSGTDIFAALTNQITLSLQQDQKLLGLSQLSTPDMITTAVQWVRMMMPGLLTIFAFLLATLNLLLARLLLGQKAGPRKPLLSTWRLPNSVVTVYVLALTFGLFGGLKSQPVFWQMINNVMFLAGFLIGIQGVAFIWRRIKERRGGYVWLVLLLLAASIQLVGDIYILIGLFDSVRKPTKQA